MAEVDAHVTQNPVTGEMYFEVSAPRITLEAILPPQAVFLAILTPDVSDERPDLDNPRTPRISDR